MSLRNKSTSASLKVWTVAELGAFYTEHRSELVSHASRILRDSAKAEEVIQDALIKVMLAAPELESTDHALGYMHRTIENLCIDIFRMEGRRPNLVVLDDASAELESTWVDNEDHVDVIAAADDAAIVRQALAMLSPAERAALVMWEIEGRSTSEIAAELGIKESAVRHTVSRARASLRKVMSELIIDKERGLTALDMLSTTYKKAAQVAKKSSKAALSLILVFFAFFGFNAMPTESDLPVVTTQENKSSSEVSSEVEAEAPSVEASANPVITQAAIAKAQAAVENAKATSFSFAGLDKAGIPTGFTVTDSTGSLGSLYITNRPPVLSEIELSLSQVAKTDSGAANIFISQRLVSDSQGFSYLPSLSYGKAGAWIPLVTKLTYLNSERMLSGDYLVTAIIKVESEVESSIVIPASTSGRDLLTAPRQVITRLVLNPGKTQILSQAVYVVEKGVK
ncbi:MAG: RNA polymerase sigma factor [Actinobacteria bacterium]|nr:RNA polymerase sigma factor [Actinomycetota bacterium]